MSDDHIHRVIPLDRFRRILSELDIDHQSWGDAFWLRFAAQAAVFCLDEPQELSKRLQHIASELLLHAKWYEALASPLRFVVAALMLQSHTTLHHFLAEYHRIGQMLDEVGLRHGGRYEPLTVMILHSSPGHDAFSMLEAERLKALYQHMKSFHWWITGIDDLPACAALAQVPGSAEVIAAGTEAIYQRLLGAGLKRGNHLQTAAHLLPLTGLRNDAAADRWLGLVRAMEAAHSVLRPAHYDALSILSLLEQPPETIVDRMLAVRRELDLCQPDLAGESSLTLAADLTALDLIRYAADGTALSGAAVANLPLRLHALRIGTMVQVSQVQVDLSSAIEVNPPVPWPYL
jgi:hypothetical protein